MSTGKTLVNWREWSDEAFRDAQALDRPILLDIGAVWCHWCHVMDTGIPGDPVHTGTYSDPEVARTIEERFVPIKVDNDRRPDINARYNMGGWPTTAFLTPRGEPLYGETYVTPQRMLGLLEHIANYYQTHKGEIATRLTERDGDGETAVEEPSLLTRDITANIVGALKSTFDPVYGGFGSSPKFPHVSALEFGIAHYAATGDAETRHIVVKSLEGMAGGGMYDKYAGGFFRYSTTRDWSIPHYEKMLEDNAALSRLCLRAADAFGEQHLAEIALSVQGWLMSVMYDAEIGAFAGSQDADREDAYYGLPLEERAKLPTPYIDRTVYLGWNAMVASSFAERCASRGEESAREIAARTYHFLKSRVWPSHYVADGVAGGPEYLLADTVCMLNAALDISAIVADSAPYLADARAYADVLLGKLLNHETGGFFDLAAPEGALGELARPRSEIGSDAEAALALIRLHAYTGEPALEQAAERALRLHAGQYRGYTMFASSYALAVAAVLAPPTHIVLVGDVAGADMRAMFAECRQAMLQGAAIERRTPQTAGEYPASLDGAIRAYVCASTECRMAADIAELRRILQPTASSPIQSG